MLQTDYARALADLLEQGMPVDQLFVHLDSTLAHRGHQSIKGRVLYALLRELQQRAQKEQVIVTVNAQGDEKHLAADIKKAITDLGAGKEHTTVTDSTLIGGFSAFYKGKRLDRSYKSALVQLYRNITTS